MRGVAFEPSGNLCAVVHDIARFQVPTTQVEFGWMNVSALSLIDGATAKVRATMLLDDARQGAANPWAVAWALDGKLLVVAHAGTHRLSVIDAEALEEKLSGVPEGTFVSDFSFLQGIRWRVKLPGNGPRALAIIRDRAYVAEYFSDSVAVVDLSKRAVVEEIALGEPSPEDECRKGERLFNDATICHQGWQSCASCHPDGRADGLNWDLLNDGIGNPKNTKSLLLAHQTPPSMSSGIRANAEQAVRSGLRHILYAVRPEPDARAIDAYLRSLRPVPSPHLVNGALSDSALRGKRLFEDPEIGCAACHPAPLFTDCRRHVMARDEVGRPLGIPLDTPSLIECWRTAPYLHDGSAATLRDIFDDPHRPHGKTSRLSEQQLENLFEYLLSL